MARDEGRDRLPAKVEDLLAVDYEYRVAVHEVADFLAQPQRMDRRMVVGEGLFLRRALLELDAREALAPCGERVHGHAFLRGCAQLLEHRTGIAHDADVHALARADLLRIDVDAYHFRVG